MRAPRLFVNEFLSVGQQFQLSEVVTHHAVHVLRLNRGAPIILFNGKGGEYTATLIAYQKKVGWVEIHDHRSIERESALQLTLVQAVSRPEHMDYTIQKAVELGVKQIIPVLTARSVSFDKDKTQKREARWHKIIYHACEQCGRNQLPVLGRTISLTEWLTQVLCGQQLVLIPTGTQAWHTVLQKNQSTTVLVGAEGGWTDKEIQQITRAGYLSVQLGPRILRTETAAIAMLALCQAWAGDWL